VELLTGALVELAVQEEQVVLEEQAVVALELAEIHYGKDSGTGEIEGEEGKKKEERYLILINQEQ